MGVEAVTRLIHQSMDPFLRGHPWKYVLTASASLVDSLRTDFIWKALALSLIYCVHIHTHTHARTPTYTYLHNRIGVYNEQIKLVLLHF